MSRAGTVPAGSRKRQGEASLGAVWQDGSEVLASEEKDTSASAEPQGPEATRGRYNKRRNPNLPCTHARPWSPVFPLSLPHALGFVVSGPAVWPAHACPEA